MVYNLKKPHVSVASASHTALDNRDSASVVMAESWQDSGQKSQDSPFFGATDKTKDKTLYFLKWETRLGTRLEKKIVERQDKRQDTSENQGLAITTVWHLR